MQSDEDDKNEDADLFRQSMQDVTPLRQGNRVRHETRRNQPRVRRAETSIIDEESYSTEYPDEAAPEVLEFCRSGIQLSKFQKLRQGKLTIEDSIDLHGCRVEEARDYLLQFLEECRQQHHTVVRIVHGKGMRSENNIPVIKTMVDRWLRETSDVLAFHSAPQNDGGTGALYVLLKRNH